MPPSSATAASARSRAEYPAAHLPAKPGRRESMSASRLALGETEEEKGRVRPDLLIGRGVSIAELGCGRRFDQLVDDEARAGDGRGHCRERPAPERHLERLLSHPPGLSDLLDREIVLGAVQQPVHRRVM